MSLYTDQNDVHNFVDAGPCGQGYLTAAGLGLATSIPASGNVVSPVINTNGNRTFAFGLTSSQAGNVSIQRYLDAAGTIPQGAPLTASLTAATAAVVNSTDGVPYQSIKITVTNTATTAATLTNTALLVQSR